MRFQTAISRSAAWTWCFCVVLRCISNRNSGSVSTSWNVFSTDVNVGCVTHVVDKSLCNTAVLCPRTSLRLHGFSQCHLSVCQVLIGCQSSRLLYTEQYFCTCFKQLDSSCCTCFVLYIWVGLALSCVQN